MQDGYFPLLVFCLGHAVGWRPLASFCDPDKTV